MSRSYHSTRWNTKNAIALCQKCHTYYTYHPLEWEQWVNRVIGEAEYAELKQKALAYDVDAKDYQKLIFEAEILLKSLQD